MYVKAGVKRTNKTFMSTSAANPQQPMRGGLPRRRTERRGGEQREGREGTVSQSTWEDTSGDWLQLQTARAGRFDRMH